MLGRRDIDWAIWNTFESYLLRSIALSPDSLEFVAYTLWRHNLEGAPIDKKRWRRVLSSVILRGLNAGRDSEVAWSLWIHKSLGMKVRPEVTAALGAADNSVIAIVALDLDDRALLRGSLDRTKWTSLLTNAELFRENWLLVYESVHKGWLTPAAGQVTADPFFQELHASDVSFYEQEKVERLLDIVRRDPKSQAFARDGQALRPFIRLESLPEAEYEFWY
jgi:hypothetical protein